MFYFFYLVVISGILYFSFKKRKFDFFTLAYFSAVIYFLPGFFGFVNEPTLINNNVIQLRVPILTETYLIMISVLVAIIGFTIIYDYFLSKYTPNSGLFAKEIEEAVYIPQILFIISLLTFLFTIYETGGDLFSGKTVVWEDMGAVHIFWRVSISLLFVISILKKSKFYFTYSSLLLILFFLMGTRSAIALSILAFLLIIFYKKGNKSLIKLVKPSVFILISIFGISMFIGKRIYGSFQSNGLAGVLETITNNEIYLESIVRSEPFTTQMILNTVIKYLIKILKRQG